MAKSKAKAKTQTSINSVNPVPLNPANAAESFGPDRISEYVSTLSSKPGVYRMFDRNDELLYVGKAKNLKKRVKAYTQYDRHPIRIRRMIRATTRMEFVVTQSETEALLLEASLIKKLKPRYNILLRDDKSFPYILMRKDHEAPQLVKHRGARKKNGSYFGPFASAMAVNQSIDTLQRAFLLRTCSDSVYASRSRPCMLHQIKRCSAPCTGEINTSEYGELISEAEAFLRGKSDALRVKMQKQMETASQNQDYEKAAEIRDRIRAMAFVRAGQGYVRPNTFSEADVAAIYRDGGQACVQVYFFRGGQNWGTNTYFPRHAKDQETGEILEAFLAQFYLGKPIPKQVLVNQDLPNKDILAQGLAERRGAAFKVIRPQRGEKAEIVSQAENNASQALARRLAETASQTKLLKQVAEVFDLSDPPERIEIYDNSHIQGTNATGAFVVAGPEGLNKREYRTFNIKDIDTEPGDDYAMMAEVMRRRFSRLLKDDSLVWPDLVLIDGGKGQLSTVKTVLEDLGVLERTVLVAIAKGPDRNAGREQFFMLERDPFSLPPKTPVLYYLQRLRDEAHRFAIGTHRAKRKKQMHTSPLDGISGVGPARKKALLAYFGSAKMVAEATEADLVKVGGVSQGLAKTIYGHFHE